MKIKIARKQISNIKNDERAMLGITMWSRDKHESEQTKVREIIEMIKPQT